MVQNKKKSFPTAPVKFIPAGSDDSPANRMAIPEVSTFPPKTPQYFPTNDGSSADRSSTTAVVSHSTKHQAQDLVEKERDLVEKERDLEEEERDLEDEELQFNIEI